MNPILKAILHALLGGAVVGVAQTIPGIIPQLPLPPAVLPILGSAITSVISLYTNPPVKQ
jgi:hypothetical protein